MRIGIACAAALAAFGLATPAAAQGLPRLGGEVSFAQDVNAGVGVRLEVPLTPPGVQDLRLDASFDYFFPNDPATYWELNTNLNWGWYISGTRIGVYFGGGLNVARAGISGVPGSSDTNVGANLLVGLRFPTAVRLTPYVELRPELGGGERLVLTAGLMF